MLVRCLMAINFDQKNINFAGRGGCHRSKAFEFSSVLEYYRHAYQIIEAQPVHVQHPHEAVSRLQDQLQHRKITRYRNTKPVSYRLISHWANQLCKFYQSLRAVSRSQDQLHH